MDEIESKFVPMARSKSGNKSETPPDKETISLIKEKMHCLANLWQLRTQILGRNITGPGTK